MRTRLVSSLAFTLVAAVPALAATELLNGVHVIRGAFAPGSQPDGNSVILTAPEGLIVVDTGRHAALHEEVLRAHLASDIEKREGRWRSIGNVSNFKE